jgi:hypothetical protein
MDTSSGDSTEKSKFEKVETLAFEKFETFIIILCMTLAIGASEASAMSAAQALEHNQILEETRQNRQETSEEGAEAASVVAASAAGASIDALPLELPKNLRVPTNMRPTLIRMLQRSATFRRQIATLARKPAVRMSVAYGGIRGDRNYHALSTVRKHEWGAMVVDTTVFVPTDLVEIIAHELEHVCEQVEGVDLRALARRRGVGVYDLNGHFETARAIRAGQEASREYQDSPELPSVPSQQTVNAAPF